MWNVASNPGAVGEFIHAIIIDASGQLVADHRFDGRRVLSNPVTTDGGHAMLIQRSVLDAEITDTMSLLEFAPDGQVLTDQIVAGGDVRDVEGAESPSSGTLVALGLEDEGGPTYASYFGTVEISAPPAGTRQTTCATSTRRGRPWVWASPTPTP